MDIICTDSRKGVCRSFLLVLLVFFMFPAGAFGAYTFAGAWGSSGSGNGQFSSPQCLAVDSSGNVYAADTNNSRIEKFDSSGTYITQWGSPGNGNGQFSFPSGVALDSSGNVYVADTSNNRIEKFDSSGTYITQWGSYGSLDGQFKSPHGIAVDSLGNVYVADTNNSRIEKFDSSGTYVTQWGNGQVQFPAGISSIVVGSSGDVYVADTYNNRIEKFDGNGTLITLWGSPGSGNGQLNAPAGIAADGSGNVYVADTGNNRIEKFIFSETVVKEFPVLTSGSAPEGITTGPDGNVWFTEITGSKIGRITTSGVVTEFSVPSRPNIIIAGPDGNLWFTESAGNKIGRITPTDVITEFVIPTNGSGPITITAGPDGNLWFTEKNAGKIGRITPAGAITEFAIPTPGSMPGDITAGPDGNLWFTENGANKIGRITPVGDITEFTVPTANSTPWGITAGPDGNLWFTERTGNKIGQITTDGTITEFPVLTANSVPGGITAGPDGDLWFTEQSADKIGRITPGGVMSEVDIPTADSLPWTITAGPDDNIWFTENNGNKIGQVVINNDVVVSPENMGDWFVTTSDSGSVAFVDGPATPPLGSGSVLFSVGDVAHSDATIRNNSLSGTPLSNLTALGLSTYTSSLGTQGDTSVSFDIYVDLNGDGVADDRLVFNAGQQNGFNPLLPQVALDTWQRWDALNGGWWATAGLVPEMQLLSGTPHTLSYYLSKYPDATILQISVGPGGQTGADWSNFVGTTDDVTIAVAYKMEMTTYDFEPAGEILALPSAQFTWLNDGTTSYKVSFDGMSSTCPFNVTCSYSWDFGDGDSGTGIVTNHTYADGTPHVATLTVSTPGGDSSMLNKVVTPVAVHQLFACEGSLQVSSAQTGQTVTFTDNTVIPVDNGGTGGAYINWGDGSTMSMGSAGGAAGTDFTHKYIWPGDYIITQIVQDDAGFSCTKKYQITVTGQGQGSNGTLTISADSTAFPISYYVKEPDAWGDMVTKASGTLNAAPTGDTTTLTLSTGSYNVYIYFATGHTCSWTQPSSVTVTGGNNTQLNLTGCN